MIQDFQDNFFFAEKGRAHEPVPPGGGSQGTSGRCSSWAQNPRECASLAAGVHVIDLGRKVAESKMELHLEQCYVINFLRETEQNRHGNSRYDSRGL